MVWAIPRSIATTKGITIVFFSSAYLDVSVQRVRLPYNGIMPIARHWVAPFGNLRINSYLHLPAAYRSLSRPSSPLRAKASSVRPCLLSYCTDRYPGLSQDYSLIFPFEPLFQRLSLLFRFFQHVNELNPFKGR